MVKRSYGRCVLLSVVQDEECLVNVRFAAGSEARSFDVRARSTREIREQAMRRRFRRAVGGI